MRRTRDSSNANIWQVYLNTWWVLETDNQVPCVHAYCAVDLETNVADLGPIPCPILPETHITIENLKCNLKLWIFTCRFTYRFQMHV